MDDTDFFRVIPLTQKSLNDEHRYMLFGLPRPSHNLAVNRLNNLSRMERQNAMVKPFFDVIVETAFDGGSSHRSIFLIEIENHTLSIELVLESSDENLSDEEQQLGLATMIQKVRSFFIQKRAQNKVPYFDEICVKHSCSTRFFDALYTLRPYVEIKESEYGSVMLPRITISCN